MLLNKLTASQPYLRPLRFLLHLRHMRAPVRDLTTQYLRQLLAVAGEDLGTLCPT